MLLFVYSKTQELGEGSPSIMIVIKHMAKTTLEWVWEKYCMYLCAPSPDLKHL